MKTSRWIYWTPRVLGLLFVAFTSIFALDVFEHAHGFWPTLAALGLHLVPTFVLLALVTAAWRWEWVGALAFPALGFTYLYFFRGHFPWFTYAIMTGPLFLMGALFFAGWRRRRSAPVPPM